MTIDELIKLLQEKQKLYWEWNVTIKQTMYSQEYMEFDIKSVKHNWENWIGIYI